MKDSNAQRVLRYVGTCPGRSASQIAQDLRLSLGTVNTALYYFRKRGQVGRKDGLGPRGGYGYFLAGKTKKRPTAWDRILQDDLFN
jgi:hypothetical protein